MLDLDDDVARLVAARAPTPAWREAAITLWVRCVEAFDDSDAERLTLAIVESARTDRDALVELARDLGTKIKDDGFPGASAVVRRAALDVLIDDPVRAIELACLLVVDLADSFDRDDIQPVIDRLIEHHPDREPVLRERFFEALRDAWKCEPIATAQGEAVLARATDPATRLDVLVKLAVLWGNCAFSSEREQMLVEHAAVIRRLVALVADAPPSAAIVRALLQIATPPSSPRSERDHASSPEALAHVARADAMARSLDVPLELLHEAAHAHAEQLVSAGELARAEAVIANLPGLDDEHLSMVGLLEDLRRRLGLASEPPASAFVVDEPHEAQPLAEGFVEHFTYDRDRLVMIRDNRVASPEKIREWSHGAVTRASDLDSQWIFGPIRDLACECTRYLGARYRGFVCERCGVEVIHSVTRTYRAAHLSLARPVVHPWYLGTLATLLETTKSELRCADPAELADKLRYFDTHRALEEARAGYRRREQLKLPILEALSDSQIKPEHLQLALLPVWPPAATLPEGVDREQLRAAYISLLDAPDPRGGVDAVFACFARR